MHSIKILLCSHLLWQMIDYIGAWGERKYVCAISYKGSGGEENFRVGVN